MRHYVTALYPEIDPYDRECSMSVTAVTQAGVSAGTPQDWDWSRDGIGVNEVEERTLEFIAKYD